jgi:serine/threonine protein kinase
MAPERINPESSSQGYDIRSDVWSLGISMIELATGKFPYDSWKNPFEQLKQVVKEDPPKLPPGMYSTDFDDFIIQCLKKDYKQRPNYVQLLEHPFIVANEQKEVDVSAFVTEALNVKSTT